MLRELEDAGLHVDRLAGASIGAVVAAVYAVGRDGAALEEVCYTEFVRHQPFSDWRLPTQSLSRGRRMRTGMVRALGADKVLEGLPRQLHIVSTDLVSRSRQVHRRGSARRGGARLGPAAGALPADPRDDGRLLIDGGVLDNLPVDLLTERDEGPVVAVNISMGGSGGAGGPAPGRPRVPALGETLLRTMMIGSGGAVAAARARGATVVTPATLGVGLLEFHQLDRMVRAGREAARALLAEGGPDLVAARDRRRTHPGGHAAATARTARRIAVNESLGATLAAVRRPSIRRALLAYLAFSVAEWATWVALLIWAFDRKGVGGASLISIVQLAPAVVVAPLAAGLGDRLRRGHALAIGYGLQGVAMLVTAVALALDAPFAVVAALGALVTCAVTLTRPVHNAVLPSLAETPPSSRPATRPPAPRRPSARSSGR